MHHLFNIYLVAFCLCLFSGCDNGLDEVKTKQNEVTDIQSKRTQALILTQASDFDPTDPSKVTGDYISREKLLIPQNLVPQNKWFMFEGPVLENDLIAFRFYGDSRHRSDIYGKSIPDLVMDTVGWDYHQIKHWGTDVLKVGGSLGIGSPAIWYKDSLYTFSEYEKKELVILKNDDTQATIRFIFTGLNIAGNSLDLIHDWSIRAGRAFTTNSISITNGQLPEGAYFATGIVKHLDEIETGTANGIFYASNWGVQSFHKENLGMAILIDARYQPRAIPNALSYLYICKNATSEVEYAFLAAWERGNSGVSTKEDFDNWVAKMLALMHSDYATKKG